MNSQLIETMTRARPKKTDLMTLAVLGLNPKNLNVMLDLPLNACQYGHRPIIALSVGSVTGFLCLPRIPRFFIWP